MIKRQYVWFRRGIKFRKNNLKYFFCNLFNIGAKAVAQRCSVKKVFLKISQNSQENTCARDSVLINFIKKETLVQVFSCEFCEIFKTPFFYRTSSVAASVIAPAQRRQQHSMSLQKSRLILKDNRADSRIKLKQSKFIAVRGELKIKYKSLFSKDFISACSYFYLVLKLVLLILVEFYQPFRRDYF